MVTQVTSFSRSGLSDWVVQRVTAVILAVYTVVLVGFLIINGELTYSQWKGLFDQTWMQIFTLLAVLSICAHAWVGMWTIGTDYIREHYFGDAADAVRHLPRVTYSPGSKANHGFSLIITNPTNRQISKYSW